ncbi:MAG: AraC family transcriptional regulator [Lachnospiraceae bacterium]|nr:AraC family transcriptional regulator [Lachnospiraceae bacterium]
MDIWEYQKYRENKVHTEKGFPYNTYLCSIPLDFKNVPMHWHEEIELIVIQKGEGIISLDLHSYSATAGDIFLVLPGHLHAIAEQNGKQMEYENILFQSSMLQTSVGDFCSQNLLQPIFQGNISVSCYIHPGLPLYENILQLIRETDSLCDKRPFGYQLAVKSNLFQLFFHLIKHPPIANGVSVNNKFLEKMKFILQYIDTHFAEEISISEMAELVFYSESHFMKFFKNNMGISFIQYLNQYRLDMARHFLTSTSMSVLEVASESGFDNISYFNRLFKQKYGITPRQLRDSNV